MGSAVRDHGCELERTASDEERHDLLFVVGGPVPDDRAFEDIGVLLQGSLDLRRINLGAAADDHIRDPAGEDDVPLVIESGDLARVIPAVAETVMAWQTG